MEITKIALTEEITSASSARSFLIAFGEHHPNGMANLLNIEAIRHFFVNITKDEDILRASEIYAYVSSKRPDTFAEMVNQHVFDGLVNVIQKNDPLLQLNALEVLKLLLSFSDGRAFLVASGSVAQLFSDLKNLQSNPFHDLLLPGKCLYESTSLFLVSFL